MDWWVQILTVGGFAGVVSALVGELLASRERRRRARYLASGISMVLENYFRACRDQVYDINLYIDSRHHAGDNHVGLPEMAKFPDDPLAWMYIKPSIVDEVNFLPAKIAEINDGIRFNLDHGYDPEGADPNVTLEPLYQMAFTAINLARRVRSAYWLPKITRTHESESDLKKSQEDFMEKLRKCQEQHGITFLDI